MHHIPGQYRQIIDDNRLVLIVRDTRKSCCTKRIFIQRKRLAKPTERIKEIQKFYAQQGISRAVRYIREETYLSLGDCVKYFKFCQKNGRTPDGY